MPIVDKFGGQVRQMQHDSIVYENIYYIDSPGVYNINDRKCLIIPGAESRDIWNLLDPADENFDRDKKALAKNHLWFRIKDWTWWENEAVDIQECEIMRVKQDWDSQAFDYILTHDSPALFCKLRSSGHGFRLSPTEGEKYLDSLRKKLNFNRWLHGHQHVNWQYPEDNRIMCLYNWIIEDPS